MVLDPALGEAHPLPSTGPGPLPLPFVFIPSALFIVRVKHPAVPRRHRRRGDHLVVAGLDKDPTRAPPPRSANPRTPFSLPPNAAAPLSPCAAELAHGHAAVVRAAIGHLRPRRRAQRLPRP